MDLITREGGGRVAVALTGELDAAEAARVMAALHASGGEAAGTGEGRAAVPVL